MKVKDAEIVKIHMNSPSPSYGTTGIPPSSPRPTRVAGPVNGLHGNLLRPAQNAFADCLLAGYVIFLALNGDSALEFWGGLWTTLH